MSTAITASKSVRRDLLLPTSLAVLAQKSVTSITRSGTTATVTCTSHGLSVGDWALFAGATHPYYNGPFQVVTSADANTVTITLRADPGGSAAGTLTLQKGLGPTNLWGDGTTPSGSPASIGSLSTAVGGELAVRLNNGSSAPGVAPTALVYASDTGLPGTWDAVPGSPVGDIVALSDSTRRVNVDAYKFVLVFAYGNTTNAVTVSAWGVETTGAFG